MIEVAEEFLLRDDDFDMPTCGVDLFIKDIIFTTGHRVRSGYDLHTRTGTNGIITIRIHLQILRDILEFVQRHIDTNDRHNLAVLIAYGVRTTDHIRLRTRVIQVRFAPPAAVVHKAILPPLHLGVVMGLTAYLTRVDTILREAAAAGFEELALLGEIIGDERHRHTRIRTQRTYRQTRSREDRIRLINIFLRQER